MILVLSLIDRNGGSRAGWCVRRTAPSSSALPIRPTGDFADTGALPPHCVIDAVATGFVVTDVSVNGVFVNDETEPLGPGISRPLVDRTRLRLGGSELRVKSRTTHFRRLDLTRGMLEPSMAAPPHHPVRFQST